MLIFLLILFKKRKELINKSDAIKLSLAFPCLFSSLIKNILSSGERLHNSSMASGCEKDTVFGARLLCSRSQVRFHVSACFWVPSIRPFSSELARGKNLRFKCIEERNPPYNIMAQDCISLANCSPNPTSRRRPKAAFDTLS